MTFIFASPPAYLPFSAGMLGSMRAGAEESLRAKEDQDNLKFYF